VQLTIDRRDAGLSPQLDVSRAQLNLARTESAVPPLRAQLAQAVHRLGVLTGRYPETLYDFLNRPGDIPPVPDTVATGMPADLLRQRPDIRRAERELAAQNARIGVATADLYPTFTLPGSFLFESIESGDLLDGGSLAYNAGPAFRWNLFTAGRVRSLVRAEEARTQEAFNAYKQTVLLAVEDVENAMVAITEARERQSILERAVQAARESVELAKDLYQNGLTAFQTVLDAERDLAEQQDALAATQGQLAQSVVLLYKALGGGWHVPGEQDGAETEPADTDAAVPLAVAR
jgi:NodT family efflux transporter outer membrane factor (OMF) lipoprotein